MAPPNEHNTIHTCMLMALEQAKESKSKTIFITFDLLLYMKLLDIVLSGPPYSEISRID